MTPNIETKTARARLPIAGKPVYARLESGLSLGYRKNASGGAWVVRISDGRRGNSTKTIGTADDGTAAADGRAILNFAQAANAARRLQSTASIEVDGTAILTVDAAIKSYETAGNHAADVARLRLNLPAALRRKAVPLLAARELRLWRDGMVKSGLSPSSANRVATSFKAAMNLAASDDGNLSVNAWKFGLSAIPEAEEANNVTRPWPLICGIVEECYAQTAELGVLVETLAVTGARISQLARCRADDLLPTDAIAIPSSAKGRKKRASRQPVPVPASLASRLRTMLRERKAAADAPLFVKASAEPWAKSDHSRPFARAVERAGDDPNVFSSYGLRHSHISQQIIDGLPIAVVAKAHDTSVKMIETHYGKLTASLGDSLIREKMRGFERPIENVVLIRKTTA